MAASGERTLRRRFFLAALLVAAAVTSTAGGSVAAAGGDTETDEPPALWEPVPETLIEPVPERQSEIVVAEGARTAGFCDVMSRLHKLEEPHPDEIDEVVTFTQRYVGGTKILDFQSKVADPSQRGKKITLPDWVRYAVNEQRAAMYAYGVRVGYVKTLQKAKEHPVGEEAARAMLDAAFLKLVDSPFTDMDVALQSARAVYCT